MDSVSKTSSLLAVTQEEYLKSSSALEKIASKIDNLNIAQGEQLIVVKSKDNQCELKTTYKDKLASSSIFGRILRAIAHYFWFKSENQYMTVVTTHILDIIRKNHNNVNYITDTLTGGEIDKKTYEKFATKLIDDIASLNKIKSKLEKISQKISGTNLLKNIDKRYLVKELNTQIKYIESILGDKDYTYIPNPTHKSYSSRKKIIAP